MFVTNDLSNTYPVLVFILPIAIVRFSTIPVIFGTPGSVSVCTLCECEMQSNQHYYFHAGKMFTCLKFCTMLLLQIFLLSYSLNFHLIHLNYCVIFRADLLKCSFNNSYCSEYPAFLSSSTSLYLSQHLLTYSKKFDL